MKRAVFLPAALLIALSARGAQAQSLEPPPPNAAPATPVPAAGARVISLEEAVRTALDRHPRLQLSRASLAAAEARVGRAVAPLLPRVLSSASYQRSIGSAGVAGQQGVVPSSDNIRSYDSFSFGVSASQLVTDFGQTTGRLHAAQAARDAQRQSSQFDRIDLTYNVRNLYFQARAQKELLRVALETLDNLKKHLAAITGFVEVGTRPPIDRVQAQADEQRGELNVTTAENNYAVAKARLLQSMGMEGSIDFDVSDETLQALPEEAAAIARLDATALGARPDLQAALSTVRGQQATLDSTRAGYYPTISLSAGASEVGNDLTELRWSASAGAALSWPIFEGGATRAAVREARANVDAANAQAAILRQQLIVDVEQAQLSVLGGIKALATAGLLVQTSRERLALAEGRYQTGVGSLLDLADAQLGLTSAQGDQVQAEFNLSTARAALLHALGRL